MSAGETLRINQNIIVGVCAPNLGTTKAIKSQTADDGCVAICFYFASQNGLRRTRSEFQMSDHHLNTTTHHQQSSIDTADQLIRPHGAFVTGRIGITWSDFVWNLLFTDTYKTVIILYGHRRQRETRKTFWITRICLKRRQNRNAIIIVALKTQWNVLLSKKKLDTKTSTETIKLLKI